MSDLDLGSFLEGDGESGLDLFGTDDNIGNSDVGGLDLSGFDNFSDPTSTPVTGTGSLGGFLGDLSGLSSQLLGGYNQLTGSVTNGLNTPLSEQEQLDADEFGGLGFQSPTQVSPTSPLSSNTLLIGGAILVVVLLLMRK